MLHEQYSRKNSIRMRIISYMPEMSKKSSKVNIKIRMILHKKVIFYLEECVIVFFSNFVCFPGIYVHIP